MKISHLTPTGQPQQVEQSKQQGRTRADKAEAGSAAPQASVTSGLISPESQDIDMARVNEIRQAISEGRLQVNLERIADGLIESTRNLLKGDA